MPINLQGSSVKLMCSDHKIEKLYCENNVIYSSGNTVTYYVDSGTVYQEEVDKGVSCLSPKTFSPAKSGWEFVGWRQDTAANGSVLSGLTMGDEPITLYAVFRQAVTVTYYNNSTTASSTSGYRYYNSGNVINPSFTLSQASRSGCTSAGWAAGNGTVAYANGATFTRDSNITLYGRYDQTITVTYYNGSTSASKVTGTRIYYSGTEYVVNPTFTLTQAVLSGWTARGWSTSTAGNGGISYNNGAAFTRDSNITLYGMYQQTVTVTYYNASTSASATSGTRYYNSGSGNVVNPTFTLTQTALSGWTARGWSTSTAGNGGISYNNGAAFTRDSNITLYGLYYQTITLTYYNGSTSAASTSGTRYYNPGSGGIVNPTFTLTPATLSGWTFRGWATSSAAAAGIAYSSISGTAFAASTTVYAAYYQTITLSYAGNNAASGSTAAQTGTRYWNTGNVANPSFTLRANGFSRSGYIFSMWALGSTGGTQYAAGANVTLSSSTTMYAVWVSASAASYAYTGGIQTYTIPADGLYCLEVWGAKGGNYDSYSGGYGGYSYGYKHFAKGTTLYIVVGGAGAYYSLSTEANGGYNGGYNGGGRSTLSNNNPSSTGGGATHIALVSGLLNTLENQKGNILIVAGGGGGAAGTVSAGGGAGGAGGGTTGGNGCSAYDGTIVSGGTQSSGGSVVTQGYITGYHKDGSFGQGGGGNFAPYGGSGGGGYYGGAGGQQSGSGGGGSGYIGGVPTLTYNGKTYTPSTANGQNNGAGSARITLVDIA